MKKESHTSHQNQNSFSPMDLEQQKDGYIIKDKYQITNFFKAGGFGEVFFAKHIAKNYDVAIKFVSNLVKL